MARYTHLKIRLLIILLSALLLQGCAVGIGAAVAVGVAVGYYYGHDQRTYSQINNDQNVSAEINTALYRQAGVNPSKIQVYTYENKVVLQGTVESEDAAARVIEVAQNTRNVTEVTSELRVISPYD